VSVQVQTYRLRPAAYHEYDPELAVVAQSVIDLIRRQDDRLSAEHIGSSAVPGCGGKGYIDLLLTYPPGELDAAKRALETLGFQRQQFGVPFPEDRPMRVGAVEHRGREFPVHVHVIADTSPEAAELLRFRDRLRSDEALRLAYAAEKRRIIGTGVTESPNYALAKTDFIRKVLSNP
jgi:GrpB-like predicted nucleotidyltransferase (UPF0157 family)